MPPGRGVAVPPGRCRRRGHADDVDRAASSGSARLAGYDTPGGLTRVGCEKVFCAKPKFFDASMGCAFTPPPVCDVSQTAKPRQQYEEEERPAKAAKAAPSGGGSMMPPPPSRAAAGPPPGFFDEPSGGGAPAQPEHEPNLLGRSLLSTYILPAGTLRCKPLVLHTT